MLSDFTYIRNSGKSSEYKQNKIGRHFGVNYLAVPSQNPNVPVPLTA